MVFLGMARKPKTLEEQRNDPIEKTKVIEGERKEVQKAFQNEYDQSKEDLKQDIMEYEYEDIKEAMLKERRDWI